MSKGTFFRNIQGKNRLDLVIATLKHKSLRERKETEETISEFLSSKGYFFENVFKANDFYNSVLDWARINNITQDTIIDDGKGDSASNNKENYLNYHLSKIPFKKRELDLDKCSPAERAELILLFLLKQHHPVYRELSGEDFFRRIGNTDDTPKRLSNLVTSLYRLIRENHITIDTFDVDSFGNKEKISKDLIKILK